MGAAARPSMRAVHRAGEKTFVDFSGKRPTLVDRRTGELRPVELFVAALGASSLIYAEATATQQLADWSPPTSTWSSTAGAPPRCGSPTSSRAPSPAPAATSPTSTAPMRIWPPTTAPSSSRRAPESPRQGSRRDQRTRGPAVILARLRDQTFFELGPLNQAIRVLLDELNDRPMKKLGVSRRALYEQLDRPRYRPCRLPATSWPTGSCAA